VLEIEKEKEVNSTLLQADETKTPTFQLRTFIREIALTFAARIGALLSMLGVSILTSRVLGPRGRGDYFFVITIAAVIAQFCNLGVHTSNTFYSAKNQDYAGNLAMNSVWLSAVVGGGSSVIVIAIMSVYQNIPGLGYVVLLVPANLFFLLGCCLLIGLGMTPWFNVLQVGAYVLLLALIAVAWRMHLGPSGFLCVTAIAWLISSLSVFTVLAPKIHLWHFSFRTFVSGFRYSTKAYFACLFGLLVLRANVFLLKHWLGSESVGYFSVAAQMSDALGTLPVVIGMLLFPKLVRDRENSWTMMTQTLIRVSGIMLVLCTMAAFMAKPFIRMMFGTAYLKATPIFLWILPGAFFLAQTSIISQYISSRDFPAAQVVVWLAGLILILMLSVILISHFGLSGSAMALSVDYALIFAMLFLLAVRLKNKETKEIGTDVISPTSIGRGAVMSRVEVSE
jgi:stage V sporulation protein B